MKKYGLPFLFAAFLIILAIWSQIPESNGSLYTISEPFVFPELTDKMPHYAQVALCTIPDEVMHKCQQRPYWKPFWLVLFPSFPPLTDFITNGLTL